MQIEHMQEFISVVKAGSISAASEDTFLAQPVLSKHIKAIETELGFELLERSHSGVKLTPAGEDAYSSFREITTIYGSLKQRLTERSSDVELLKIGMLNLGVGRYVIPATLRFQQQHPTTEVRYSTEKPKEMLNDLLEGSLDVAFLGGDKRLKVDGLSFLRITDEEVFFLISRKHPNATTETITPADLSGHPLICLRDQPSTEYMNSIILASGIMPSSIIGVDELELVPAAIAKSGGFFAVPEFMMEKFSAFTEISAVRYKPKLTMQVSFVYNPENTNPALANFISVAKRISKELAKGK